MNGFCQELDLCRQRVRMNTGTRGMRFYDTGYPLFLVLTDQKINNQYPVFDREMLLISRYWPVSFRNAGQFARVPPFGLPVFANCVQ